jgi:hypothetical protein
MIAALNRIYPNISFSASGKVDESAFGVRRQELYIDLLAEPQSVFTANDAAIDRRTQYARKRAAICDPCDHGIKALTYTTFHDRGRDDLSQFALDLACTAFLLIAMIRDQIEFVPSVWLRFAVYRGFNEALNDHIRIPTVRRSRMSIIANAQPKVSVALLTGLLHDVLTGADEFYDRERKVGKMQWILLLSDNKKLR